MRESKLLAVSAVLTALSFLANFLPFFRVPWGMQLDFMGALWVLALFLYGLRCATLVSVSSSLLLAFFSSSGWLGGVMKFAATYPMVLILFAGLALLRKKPDNVAFVSIISVPAILFRSLSMAWLNLYVIPLFTGWPASMITPLVPQIILLNAALGAIEVAAAWLLFSRLKRFRETKG